MHVRGRIACTENLPVRIYFPLRGLDYDISVEAENLGRGGRGLKNLYTRNGNSIKDDQSRKGVVDNMQL